MTECDTVNAKCRNEMLIESYDHSKSLTWVWGFFADKISNMDTLIFLFNYVIVMRYNTSCKINQFRPGYINVMEHTSLS